MPRTVKKRKEKCCLHSWLKRKLFPHLCPDWSLVSHFRFDCETEDWLEKRQLNGVAGCCAKGRSTWFRHTYLSDCFPRTLQKQCWQTQKWLLCLATCKLNSRTCFAVSLLRLPNYRGVQFPKAVPNYLYKVAASKSLCSSQSNRSRAACSL